MKRKRILMSYLMLSAVTASFADSGLSGLDEAAGGVGSYIPVAQGICYAIASVIAIVGAVSVYLAIHNNQGQIAKRISMCAGGALCFVCLATAMPQFFGYSSTGGSGSSDGGFRGNPEDYFKEGFLSTDQGAISQSAIITSIPSLNDPRENWIHFPSGVNMRAAEYVTDVYNHMGAGKPGSYGNTLDYINRMYQSGMYDENTYNQIMSVVGNLPHN